MRKNSCVVNGIKVRLTDAEVRKVIEQSKAYSAFLADNKPTWAPNDDIVNLAIDPTEFGFHGLVRTEELDAAGIDLRHLEGPEVLENLDINLAVKKGKGPRKGGGKPFPKGPNNLPSANVFEHTIALYMKGETLAAKEGALKLLEQNAQFGDRQKAITYAKGWKLIVEPHHLGFWSEIDRDFLQEVGKANGHGYWASKANTRNQAVGITASPRLRKIAGPFSVDACANVQGIPDLRPAFVVIFEDTWSGLIIRAVAIHWKSMRGGVKLASAVQFQQTDELAKWLGPASGVICPPIKNIRVRNTWKNQIYGRSVLDHGTVSATIPLCVLPDAERNLDINERIKRAVTIIGGDWNMLLGTPVTGNVPLIRAGYLLVDPTSTVTTQAHGGRLDGWHADKPNPQSGCDADAPEGSKEIGENGEDK